MFTKMYKFDVKKNIRIVALRQWIDRLISLCGIYIDVCLLVLCCLDLNMGRQCYYCYWQSAILLFGCVAGQMHILCVSRELWFFCQKHFFVIYIYIYDDNMYECLTLMKTITMGAETAAASTTATTATLPTTPKLQQLQIGQTNHSLLVMAKSRLRLHIYTKLQNISREKHTRKKTYHYFRG